MKTRIVTAVALAAALALGACSNEPEVGSKEWCEAEDTDSYTEMNQIMTYMKHCMMEGEEPEAS